MNERGQVLPLIAVLVVVAGAASLVLGRLGGAAVARAQAVTAADAAALAGAATDDRALAGEFATANGARLRTYEALGTDARVTVELGGARATARARAEPDSHSWGSSAAESTYKLPQQGHGHGLAPAMRAALARAGQLLGQAVPVTSGWRSRAEQAALYARRAGNLYPVAPPGASRHESGLAVDVPLTFVPRLLAVAARAGLCRPYARTDPVHFELCPPQVR